MQFGMPPFSTRILSAVAVASVAVLGWTLLGPRALPAPAATSAATTFPVYPVASTQELRTVNAANPAWAQPLFFRDRKPRMASLGDSGDGSGAAAVSFDATLTGIIRSATLNAASLQRAGQPQPVRVRLGQEVPDAAGWRLVELTAKTARFQSGSDEKILKLEVPRPDGLPPPMPMPEPLPVTANPTAAGQRNEAPAANAGSGNDASRNAGAKPAPPPAANTSPEQPPQPIASPNQQQQIEAVRQRIEAARKAQRQPAPSANH